MIKSLPNKVGPPSAPPMGPAPLQLHLRRLHPHSVPVPVPGCGPSSPSRPARARLSLACRDLTLPCFQITARVKVQQLFLSFALLFFSFLFFFLPSSHAVEAPGPRQGRALPTAAVGDDKG